jgi:hypothetical protein
MSSCAWLSLNDAICAVRDALQVSDRMACTMIVDACATKVRSRQLPWSYGEEPAEYWMPISDWDWRCATIHPVHRWLIAAQDRIVRGDILVNADDLNYWHKSQQAALSKPAVGKRPRIIKLLTEMYPGGVPDPGHCPRKELKAKLLERDPSLDPLDEGTLKKAIEEYNGSMIRNDPIRIVSE